MKISVMYFFFLFEKIRKMFLFYIVGLFDPLLLRIYSISRKTQKKKSHNNKNYHYYKKTNF